MTVKAKPDATEVKVTASVASVTGVTAPPAPPVAAPELTPVAVMSSEAPDSLHRRRGEEHQRFEDLSWREQAIEIFKFVLAPLVEHWRGWSLTRILATWAGYWTVELAHDWLETVRWANKEPGWAFVVFVIGGLFVAAVMALGAKYIDHLLTIVAAKMGIILTGPLPPSIP